MHSRWHAASWRRRASRPLSLPTRSRCCSSPTAQHPPDRRLARAVHLHELATCRPVGEQALFLGLLLIAEGSALRLGGEVGPCATERVADGVAAQVVPLGKLVRGCPGLVVLDQELDDRPVEGVLLGERAVIDLSCRLACRGQELGQFRGFPRLLAVASQESEMLCVVERSPLGQSFRDPDVEAGRTVTALQPAAVRPSKEGTIPPAWRSTSASKRKTDTRIGRSAPRPASSFTTHCSTKWKPGPTITDRPDRAGLSPMRVAHDDLGGEQMSPDSARRVAQHCSDAFK